ncbi:MAG: hypothetical protein H5T86_14520 [Armatimonadetes bacterium]|nr:hypothetical protein [Armatimonadota bacterium]
MRQKEAWGDIGAVEAEAVQITGAAVPLPVARIRFNAATFLWGAPWCLAHRLYSWAATDLALSAVTVLALAASCHAPSWPWSALFAAASVSAWAIGRVAMAQSGAVQAWRRRSFRDLAEFRAVQTAWLVCGLVIVCVLLLFVAAPLP